MPRSPWKPFTDFMPSSFIVQQDVQRYWAHQPVVSCVWNVKKCFKKRKCKLYNNAKYLLMLSVVINYLSLGSKPSTWKFDYSVCFLFFMSLHHHFYFQDYGESLHIANRVINILTSLLLLPVHMHELLTWNYVILNPEDCIKRLTTAEAIGWTTHNLLKLRQCGFPRLIWLIESRLSLRFVKWLIV